jgi:hypothetical protein
MPNDERLTWGFILAVLDVPERHGYRRRDHQHTGEATGLIRDVARIYEGTLDRPRGGYVVVPSSQSAEPQPPGPPAAIVPADQVKTLLAALDEAAEYKRDRAETCADCADQSCTTSHWQRNGHLPVCHLDFRSAGGYVLAPRSAVGGKSYQLLRESGGRGGLDWVTVTGLLQSEQRHQQRPRQPQAPRHDLGDLAHWVAAQPEGNRNAGLFWAANRALDADPAADLSPLAAAARHAGLGEPEITRTLDSARNSGRTRPPAPDYQAEAGDQA